MLLGAIVEAVSGQRLDTYVYENFYQPLGLDSLVFNPLDHGFTTQDTVSSELHGNTRDGRISFENERTEVVTGQVHDEKAFYSMGGISGHLWVIWNDSRCCNPCNDNVKSRNCQWSDFLYSRYY
ncbi:serine hydrolase [Erysipelothrix sp. D19-032]